MITWLKRLICDCCHDWRRVMKIGPGEYACAVCGLRRKHPAFERK